MKRDIIAEIKKLLLKNMVKSVLAEEGGEGEPTEPTPTSTINYEDLIQKARKEEKEKQFKVIERLRTQVNTLTEQHNGDLLSLAEKDKEIASLNDKLTNSNSGDSEQVKTLKAELKEKDKEIKSLQAKIDEYGEPVNVDELTEQIRGQFEQEYTVKEHRLQVLSDNKEQLLVPELVMGTTIEEIDNSLKSALERSEEIRKSLGVNGNTQQSNSGVNPNIKPSNPSTSSIQTGSLDLDALAHMDVRSPEYAELRKKLNLR